MEEGPALYLGALIRRQEGPELQLTPKFSLTPGCQVCGAGELFKIFSKSSCETLLRPRVTSADEQWSSLPGSTRCPCLHFPMACLHYHPFLHSCILWTQHWQKANPATFCGISGLNWGNHGGAWWVLKLTLGGDWDSMAGRGSRQVVVLILLARKLIAVQRYGHRSCQMVPLVCFQSLLMWSNWAGSHKSKFCVPFQREGT